MHVVRVLHEIKHVSAELNTPQPVSVLCFCLLFVCFMWSCGGFLICGGLQAARGSDPEPIGADRSLQACSAVDQVLAVALWRFLSSGAAVGALSIQLRVHSGRPGEEIRLHCHTWLMSLCSSTPSLISSLPPSIPPLSLSSLAQYLPHVLYEWGAFLYVCGADERSFIVCKRQRGGRRGRKR